MDALTILVFLPLVGVLVMMFIPRSDEVAIKLVGIVTAGATLAVGIALLALPGPGWATIFIGMMILASEFAWARRSLDWTKERARVAHAKATAPEARRRNQIITAVGLLLAAVDDRSVVDQRSNGCPDLAFKSWVAANRFRLSISTLGRWHHWITPELMPRRFDTFFFTAPVEQGRDCRPDNHETSTR